MKGLEKVIRGVALLSVLGVSSLQFGCAPAEEPANPTPASPEAPADPAPATPESGSEG
jgi:hypothetical protein